MVYYIKGSALEPVGEGRKVIVHICNDIGRWGSGFVKSISGKWKLPEKKYRKWFHSKKNFKLGHIQCVVVEPNIIVVNMIAQKNIWVVDGIPPIRYSALKKCLGKVVNNLNPEKDFIHMPRIGAGLAGGDWVKILEIIEETLKDFKVYIYKL